MGRNLQSTIWCEHMQINVNRIDLLYACDTQGFSCHRGCWELLRGSSQHPLWQSPLLHVLLSWFLSWRGQSPLLYQRPAAGSLWEFVALSQEKRLRGAGHRGQHNPLFWGLFHHDECHWGWVAMSSHLWRREIGDFSGPKHYSLQHIYLTILLEFNNHPLKYIFLHFTI